MNQLIKVHAQLFRIKHFQFQKDKQQRERNGESVKIIKSELESPSQTDGQEFWLHGLGGDTNDKVKSDQSQSFEINDLNEFIKRKRVESIIENDCRSKSLSNRSDNQIPIQNSEKGIDHLQNKLHGDDIILQSKGDTTQIRSLQSPLHKVIQSQVESKGSKQSSQQDLQNINKQQGSIEEENEDDESDSDLNMSSILMQLPDVDEKEWEIDLNSPVIKSNENLLDKYNLTGQILNPLSSTNLNFIKPSHISPDTCLSTERFTNKEHLNQDRQKPLSPLISLKLHKQGCDLAHFKDSLQQKRVDSQFAIKKQDKNANPDDGQIARKEDKVAQNYPETNNTQQAHNGNTRYNFESNAKHSNQEQIDLSVNRQPHIVERESDPMNRIENQNDVLKHDMKRGKSVGTSCNPDEKKPSMNTHFHRKYESPLNEIMDQSTYANHSKEELQVLIADDDSFSISVLKMMLKKSRLFTFQIKEVYNGQESLLEFKKRNAPNSLKPFSLVISDVNMPIMSGIESIRFMRKAIEDQFFHSAKFIGISGLDENQIAQDPQLQSDFKAFDIVLHKPFQEQALLNVINQNFLDFY